MASKASKWFHAGPKIGPSGHRNPQGGPKKPKPLQNPKKINDFGPLALSLPMGSRGRKKARRWHKRAPRDAESGHQTAPRARQERSKRPWRGDCLGLQTGCAD
eukprot:2831498-Pyramimonas_sp.AAC.1